MYLDTMLSSMSEWVLIILDFWVETGDIFWLKLRYNILKIY
jgi:hypothetical protein